MDAPERKQLYSGFGEGLSRAFEMAATPAIIAGIGWLIDRAAGTSPLFTLVMFALGVIGMGVRTWYAYDRDMQAEERRLLGGGTAEERRLLGGGTAEERRLLGEPAGEARR